MQKLAYLFLFFTIFSCGEKKDTSITSKIDSRPNIIWLVAEDQSPDFFPMYGDNTIALPHLESLANESVIFDNAFSPVPVCAPARSALITGMYPTTLGTHNMRTYKAWGNENEPTIDLPNYSPIVPDGVKMFTEYLRKEGYYCVNGPKEDYNFAKTEGAWDESSKNRHWRNREADQPIFAVFNYSVCHESQIWKRGKDSLFVDPTKVPIPPYFPDTEVVRHDLAVNYSNLKRLDDQIGRVIDQLKEDGLYENSIIFFYGDHGGPFPRHKRALYDSGVKVPLTIKFPKNHNAGTRDERLISFIDFAPTVLSIASIDPPKVMQGVAQFGENVEANLPKYTFHSSDRFDAQYDRLRAVRSKRYKYIKSFDTNVSHAMPVAYREQMPMMQELREMFAKGDLTDEQALWLQPTKPEEELYDLLNDPYELHNLVFNLDQKDTLAHYRKILDNWIIDSKDLGQFAEKELIAKWLPNGTPPKLPALEMEEKAKGVYLFSKHNDATIVWKQPKDTIWTIFDNPIPKELPFIAKTSRIGYEDSEMLSIEY